MELTPKALDVKVVYHSLDMSQDNAIVELINKVLNIAGSDWKVKMCKQYEDPRFNQSYIEVIVHKES